MQSIPRHLAGSCGSCRPAGNYTCPATPSSERRSRTPRPAAELLAQAARPILEALERRQLLAGQMPDGWSLMETIQVPASGASVFSNASLQDGMYYKARATGTVNIGGGKKADAEYRWNNSNPEGTHLDYQLTGGGGKVDWGLFVNQAPITQASEVKQRHMGPWQTDHEYVFNVFGTGGTVQFQFADDNYGGNSGTLTVELFHYTGDGDVIIQGGGFGGVPVVLNDYAADSGSGIVGFGGGDGGGDQPSGDSGGSGVSSGEGRGKALVDYCALSADDVGDDDCGCSDGTEGDETPGAGGGGGRGTTPGDGGDGGSTTDGGILLRSGGGGGGSSGGGGSGSNWNFTLGAPQFNWNADFFYHRPNNPMGNGWFSEQEPFITEPDGNSTVAVIMGDGQSITFDYDEFGETYTARHFVTHKLTNDSVAKEFTLVDTTGHVFVFSDFSTSLPSGQRGQLKSRTDPAGNKWEVSTRNSNGYPTLIKKTNTNTAKEERQELTYLTSGTNSGKLETITHKRGEGSTFTTVRSWTLAYYGTGDSNGNSGDLKTIVNKDPSGNVIDTAYFRYYTSDTSDGFTKGLKLMIKGDQYELADSEISGGAQAATDAALEVYADYKYKYDSNHKVKEATTTARGCSTCTAGLGTFNYSYSTSSFGDGYNNWKTKTIETLPDGSKRTTYTNAYTQPMLILFEDGKGGSWRTYFKYDGNGRLLWKAQPSAVSGHDQAYADLVRSVSGNYQYLYDSSGLIEVYEYSTSTTATSSTAGGVNGYLKNYSLRRGETGTNVKQFQQDYFSRTANSKTVYPIATRTAYENTDGTGGLTTSWAYTWYTSSLQAQQVTRTLPTVSTGRNGPGSASTTKTYYDMMGRPTWYTGEDGFIHYTEYDQEKPNPITKIVDVNTARDTDSDGDDDEASGGRTFLGKPSGWATPSGGGLHLTSRYELDHMGRTTTYTDPAGNITYVTYNDDTLEKRIYQGWDSSLFGGSGGPTGPTIVQRVDRARGYTETLTMSAAPTVSSGKPTGTESISSLESLTRAFRNDGGQITQLDRYHDLTGLTYTTSTSFGTINDDFYRTEYGYDYRGRRDRVKDPTGTITRIVYDPAGRVLGTWVGTDDTGAHHDDPNGSPLADSSAIGTGQASYGNSGNPWLIDNKGAATRILARNFDVGGEGVSFHETDSANNGGGTSYRTDYPEIDIDGNGKISYFANTEWLEYSITTRQAGTYTLRINGAQGGSGSNFRAVIGGDDETGTVTFAATGGWNTYVTREWAGLQLNEGLQALKIEMMNSNGLNIDWIELIRTGPLSTDTARSGNDMLRLASFEYDNNTSGGDSNLTRVTQHVDATSGNDRVSLFDYDWRDRLMLTRSGVTFSGSNATPIEYLYATYDNLNQPLTSERFHSSTSTTSWSYSNGVPASPASSDRTHKRSTSFDELGRVWRSENFSVNTSTGAVGSSLKSDFWYDRRGNVIKNAAPGGLVTKNAVDGAGRKTATYFSDGGGDTAYADADDVTGDTVLEERHNTYDSAGNVTMVTSKLRFHDATATGALGDASTNPKARVSFSTAYYDKANRQTAGVDVGTNGGSSYSRPGTAPSRSDTVLVTSQTYDAAGNPFTSTDPRGNETRTTYDDLRRRTKLVEAYVDGTPSAADDRTTLWTYNGLSQLLTLTADLPSGSTDQTTTYIYGATTTRGDALHSNGILISTDYPDIGGGVENTESYKTNRAGQRTSLTDRNGTTHTYTYDLLGRLTLDDVTTLGSGVDGTVRKLETSYDDQGLPLLLTSKNSSGTVLNQIERIYNGLGQLITEKQEHNGAATAGSLKVQYAYSEMTGGANHSRPTSMTYPDGRVLSYVYDTGLDNTIGRLSKLSFAGTDVETYAYLGLSMVVVRDRPQANHALTYQKQGAEGNGDAGDQYTGLDRFGRVADQRWLLDAGGHADRFTYGHDRNGNRLWRKNELSSAHSELYMADGADEQAAYDKLDRLVEFQRGTLSDAVGSDGYFDTVSTASRSQAWSLDALGNWASLTNDGGSAQARTHDVQNRLATVSGATSPVHSANGEMTTDETGQTLKYDAWGMLIEINVDGTGAVEITNAYDALHRRIKRNSNEFYYTAQWQQIEERDAQGVEAQFVWSPVYVDAMISKDRDTDNDGVMETTDERLYVVHDANFNVTALLDASGIVLERFVYDAYGTRSVLDANWSADSDNTSDSGFQFGHQGGMHDLLAGLVYFRNRWLDTSLGRWNRPDPIGFVDGANRYGAYLSRPATGLDPIGLTTRRAPPQLPLVDDEDCCELVRPNADPDDRAKVVCCNGNAIPCIVRRDPVGEDPTATNAIHWCARLHESMHIRLEPDNCIYACGDYKPNGSIISPSERFTWYVGECQAHLASQACLAAGLSACRSAKCVQDILAEMQAYHSELRKHCAATYMVFHGIEAVVIDPDKLPR